MEFQMRKVLVLEDQASIRSFVVINLRRSGYEPIEAGTGPMLLNAQAAPDKGSRSWTHARIWTALRLQKIWATDSK
jgi:hypothetical protein